MRKHRQSAHDNAFRRYTIMLDTHGRAHVLDYSDAPRDARGVVVTVEARNVEEAIRRARDRVHA